jgi:hypothetical protein
MLGELLFRILTATAHPKLVVVSCSFFSNSLSSALAEFEVCVVRWVVTVTELTAAKTESSKIK